MRGKNQGYPSGAIYRRWGQKSYGNHTVAFAR
jgi:hypothetical protein